MIRPTSRKSSSSPRIVIAGVPTRMPEATVGGRSSKGTVLRFTVIPTAASRSSASLPLHSVRRRSTSSRCVSVPPVSTSSPPSCSDSASASAFARTALWYSRNGPRRDLEACRLRRDHVIQRTALHPREDGAVDRLRVLLPAEDESRAGPRERLVRRRGDEVAVLDGIRVQARGNEPREWAMSQRRRAPTTSAISTETPALDRPRMEPPHTMSFGRCFSASADVAVVDEVRLA